MTSQLKIKANRANSRASTGPRTQYGRGRAARNALRHGLSLPVCSDPVLSEQVDALAREIVGGDANAEIQHSARRIAEAQIDLRRIRQARHQLLTDALRDSPTTSANGVRKPNSWVVFDGLTHQNSMEALTEYLEFDASRRRQARTNSVAGGQALKRLTDMKDEPFVVATLRFKSSIVLKRAAI